MSSVNTLLLQQKHYTALVVMPMKYGGEGEFKLQPIPFQRRGKGHIEMMIGI